MRLLTTIAAVATLTLATSANAAIYDFAAEGNAQEAGYSIFDSSTSFSSMDSGLTITAGSTLGGSDYYAYMDGSSGAVGGLGVCQAVDLDKQCTPTSDDNQIVGEYITMVLDIATEILGLTIQGDHGTVAAGTYLNYSFDGVAQTAIDISGANLTFIALAANAATTTLDYYITNASGAQIYVTALTTVPIPAAALLFGSALLGLFGFGRRKAAGGNAIAA